MLTRMGAACHQTTAKLTASAFAGVRCRRRLAEPAAPGARQDKGRVQGLRPEGAKLLS